MLGKIKNGLMLATYAGFIAGALSASALSINDPGVVGTVRSGEPASVTDEVIYVNNLLGLGANIVNQVISGHTYSTSSTDYNGSVSAVGASQLGGTSVPVGFQYVLAKYDGPNGGDVLWFLGGSAFVIPADSSGLWVNTAGKGYGLSHFTVFGPTRDVPGVPDSGSSLMLLGLALSGVASVRRWFLR